ncbi:SinI family restriction endonuclease [Latilactobacillus curvatus]|uniref:SinI family restriction endonuclease n=1 Tax=Latilactobacillus curvatus TaxID=28038 RepID=UPI0039B0E11D
MANSKRPSDYVGTTIPQFQQHLIEVLTEPEFITIFPISSPQYEHITTLFTIALSDMNTLFPNAGVKQSFTDPKDYIRKWVSKYANAYQTPPSKRAAKLPGSAIDPALGVMVQERQHLSEDAIQEKISAHQLFMSAENIQGSLLEEYIASIVEPQSWIWARGETLRACDFVKPSNIITTFVQIKNRDNTENSSSSAIRNGTQIQKWFRLKTLRKIGKPIPAFMWENLNLLMGLNQELTSENSYQNYLKNVVSENPNVIRG